MPEARDPLDLEMIAELRSILRDDGVRELLELYLEEAPRALASLERAFASDDGSALRTAAHGLKGAAAGVGARDVADVARALEYAAHEGRRPLDLAPLRAALEVADAALRALLRPDERSADT